MNIKKLIVIIPILLTSCTLYKFKRCPESANEYSECSTALVLSSRKFTEGVEFEYTKNKDGASVKFQADRVDDALSEIGAQVVNRVLPKIIDGENNE